MQFTIEEEELLQKLGLRLRKARILRGDKQKQLAARTGISMTIIGRIEKGDPSVSFGRYLKMAAAPGGISGSTIRTHTTVGLQL